MSIFTKDCPQCAETNAAYAVRCKCGFAFNADDGDAEAQTEEQIALDEEKLYQEYLAARAQQTDGAATDTVKLAAAQPADQAKLKEAKHANVAAKRTQAEPRTQTTRASGSTTERKHAKIGPPTAPAVTQPRNVAPVPVTPKTSAPTPTVQAPIPAGTTQTQTPKPSAEAKQSWLISATESDAQPDAPTLPLAIKPTTPVKTTTNAAQIPMTTKVDTAKMSAAERAKKLEQRLKAVQTKQNGKAAAVGTNAINKIDTNSTAAKPTSDSTRVAATATPRPPAAPVATTPAATTAAKTDDMGAPPASEPISVGRDTKLDQSQTIDKTATPEPRKVNGSDTVPPASDTIEAPATKESVPAPSTTVTAKADLEAALQALNTTTAETGPTISTPTEGDNDVDQAHTAPEELLDANPQLGDLNQKASLGCTEKECPNCTALVPMDSDCCGCGFTFPPDDDALPSLSLSDSDVEALEKRKKSSRMSHLG